VNYPARTRPAPTRRSSRRIPGGSGAGRRPLCFCDTVGLLTPERTAAIIPPLLFAPLSIHCHDDLGFALANTVAALRAGASCAHVTVNGLGERAGNTGSRSW
jgi:D-citramalate synthase